MLIDNLQIRKDLIESTKRNFNIEVCGIIVDFDGDIKVIECNNHAQNKKEDFFIDRKELNEKIGNGKLLGYYHSHDGDAELSIQDLAVANKLNLIAIIINKANLEIKEFTPDPTYISAFHDRPFIAGYLDCSELVKDYYYKILNISLPTINHPIKNLSWSDIKEHWEELQCYNKPDYNYLLDYFLNNGFNLINKNDLQKHDIILCRAREIEAPVHCLIYLGNNNILHHPSERVSGFELYSNFYKKLTTHCLRHNLF